MDPFQNLLNLEEQYYAEGHALGVSDGAAAGRAEGRLFGMQKAFEKFQEIGRLHGQAIQQKSNLQLGQDQMNNAQTSRLTKHLDKILDITDMKTLPTENNDDAVAEVDERLREAKAKSLLISRMSSKNRMESNSISATRIANASSEMEDFTGVRLKQSTSAG